MRALSYFVIFLAVRAPLLTFNPLSDAHLWSLLVPTQGGQTFLSYFLAKAPKIELRTRSLCSQPFGYLTFVLAVVLCCISKVM